MQCFSFFCNLVVIYGVLYIFEPNLLTSKTMKKVFFYLFCLSLFSLCSISCSDDDEFPFTGENGRLSGIKYVDNTSVQFYYQGNKISQIKDSEGFVSDFNYVSNEPSKISYYPTDPRVADGNGATSFKREGNKIKVESWGEPSFSLYLQEIELDENEIPVKITDLGIFEYRDSGLEEIEKGNYYAFLTYDPNTRSLLKEEVFSIKTSEKIASFTYEYEQTPAVMSKVDLPLWFYAYKTHMSYWESSLNNLYFNYSENLIRKVIDDDLNNRHSDIRYTYEYNADGFPVRMFTGSEGFSINY